MSRTYKDKKWELRFPEDRGDFGHILVGKWRWLQLPGIKTKKRRKADIYWKWYQATPSAWTRLMMNRPQRRKCRLWEQKILFQNIEEADCPFYGKKPHIYYW